MPPPSDAAGMISVSHEAIPEFRDRSGKKIGMEPMKMNFGRLQGVTIEGIDAGDKVEMQVEVRWDQRPPLRISALKKLPDDTQLALTD